MKKTYNSFKMFGSWLGAIFAILVVFIIQLFRGYVNLTLPSLTGTYKTSIVFNFGNIIFFILAGYLFGWLLYKLVKYLKK